MPTQYFIDWSKDAVNRLRTATRADIKQRKNQTHKITLADHKAIASRFQNSEYYFRQGLTFSRTGIYSPTFRLNSNSAFDTEGSLIFSDEILPEVMLALLSSVFCRYILKCFVNHTVHAQIEDIKEFFISHPDKETTKQIEKLVSKIILNQKNDPKYLYHLHEQKEIDQLVYKLYNLSDEDIREVEIWYCRRYQKLAEAQGMLAEVRQKYADYLELCEQNINQQTTDLLSNQNLETVNLTAA